MNLGPAVTGAAVQSRLDETPSEFYQVLEVTPGAPANSVPNPGFEDPGVNSLGSDKWAIAVPPSTGASMTITSSYGAVIPHGGEKMLQLESTTAATGPVPAPNTDVRSLPFEVEAGAAYTLSFYAAHPAKVGGANPQYHVFFYNATNGVVGGPIFTSFSGIGTAWTKVTASVTPPSGATKLTIGFIQAMGTANSGHWVTLIDDVSLSTGTAGPDVINPMPTTGVGAVEVIWNSETAANYQFQSSTDLEFWDDIGPPMAGTGGFLRGADFREGPEKFYRAKVLP